MNGHSLHYENEKISIAGVTEVKGFEDKEVAIALVEGGMVIKGSGLAVDELNIAEGKAEIRGKIASVTYSGVGEKGGFFKKLFK